MRWALLLGLGCVGGGKESGSPPAVDDCSDGEIGHDQYDVEFERLYCEWAAGCGVIPGETYEECLVRFNRDGCVYRGSLYDRAGACVCLEVVAGADCYDWGGEGCYSEPWWDCDPDTFETY